MGTEATLTRGDKVRIVGAVIAALILAWLLWSLLSAKRTLQQQAATAFQQAQAQQAETQRLMDEVQAKVSALTAQVEAFDAQWNARIDQLGLLRNARPPDDYIIYAQDNAERAANALIQDHAGVRFHLRRCERASTTVDCTVNLENVADKPRLVWLYSQYSDGTTLLLDEASNSYPARQFTFSSKTAELGALTAPIDPGLKVNAVFSFTDVQPEAKWGTLRLAGWVEGVPEDQQQVSLVLKEVAISSQE